MPESPSDEGTDRRLLRLNPADNVAAAATTIEAGETLTVDGRAITLTDRVPTGHKVAIAAIRKAARESEMCMHTV